MDDELLFQHYLVVFFDHLGQNGFCLWQKRLEKHRFIWPRSRDDGMEEVEQRELMCLLEGLDVGNMKGHGRLMYRGVI